jgi:hypothetical protein
MDVSFIERPLLFISINAYSLMAEDRLRGNGTVTGWLPFGYPTEAAK